MKESTKPLLLSHPQHSWDPWCQLQKCSDSQGSESATVWVRWTSWCIFLPLTGTRVRNMTLLTPACDPLGLWAAQMCPTQSPSCSCSCRAPFPMGVHSNMAKTLWHILQRWNYENKIIKWTDNRGWTELSLYKLSLFAYFIIASLPCLIGMCFTLSSQNRSFHIFCLRTCSESLASESLSALHPHPAFLGGMWRDSSVRSWHCGWGYYDTTIWNVISGFQDMGKLDLERSGRVIYSSSLRMFCFSRNQSLLSVCSYFEVVIPCLWYQQDSHSNRLWCHKQRFMKP